MNNFREREMDWASSVFWRGGLLPLTLNGDYILGRDNKHSTLIDLGGHRELTDADILATAVREAKEESLGLIDVPPAWLHSAYLYAGTALFPVNVPWTTEELIRQFHLRTSQPADNLEVTQLVPIPEEMLMQVIERNEPPLYHRTRNVVRFGNYVRF